MTDKLFWGLLAGGAALGLWGLSRARGTITGGKGDTSTPAPSRGRVYVQGGMLHGPVSSPVQLTDTDKLWLARALVGETGGRDRRAMAAVTWAMAQNLMLVGANPPRYSTFTGLIRAYSQPVNPRWENEGTAVQIARRRSIRTMTWAQIPSTARQVVDDFWAGTLENPIGTPGAELVDFAAAGHFTPTGPSVDIGGNVFVRNADRRIA
jgi:hypothetical protein